MGEKMIQILLSTNGFAQRINEYSVTCYSFTRSGFVFVDRTTQKKYNAPLLTPLSPPICAVGKWQS
jgi:hypothetical protein